MKERIPMQKYAMSTSLNDSQLVTIFEISSAQYSFWSYWNKALQEYLGHHNVENAYTKWSIALGFYKIQTLK